MKTLSTSNYTRVRRTLEKLSNISCTKCVVNFLLMDGCITGSLDVISALDYFKVNSLSVKRVYIS